MIKSLKLIIKILSIILILVFIYISSYVISYLKYDNKTIVECDVLKKENKRLQKEINKLEKAQKLTTTKYKYEIARVITRNIDSYYKKVIINKGSDNNIKRGFPVLNEEGLIGIVDKVDKKTSIVRLLTSKYNVSIKINDTYGNLSNGKITMLDKYSNIKENDIVYTSGLTTIPEDIYIGKIKDIRYDKQEISKETSIDLIDNKNLNYVMIITDNDIS